MSEKNKQLQEKLKNIKARDIMTTSVITVNKDMPLSELATLMIEKRISGAPVVGDEGEPVGMVTATDLFTIMYMIQAGDVIEKGQLGVCNPTVTFAMSSVIISIPENTSLDEIIDIMRKRNIHTIPVTDGKKMVGIIGRHDVFKNFYAAVGDLFSK